MTDMEGMMPQLTLNADAAKVETPTLTLGAEPAAPALEPEKPKAEPVVIDDSMLTEAEKKVVDDFSKKIDLNDSQLILQYGVAAQKGVASFSESALSKVRTKDLGEVGDTLSSLVVELKSFGQEEEEKGLFGFFKKAGNKMEAMKAQYGKAEANVEKIARELQEGNIDADPRGRSEQENACTYCEFASACHFTDGEGGDRRKPLRPVKPEEFWGRIDMLIGGEETPWASN